MATPPQILIIGTGIIGLSAAYYLTTLSCPSSSITLIDSSLTLFSCASGRAGGFIAADWLSPRSSSLGLLSFKLHEELAEEFGGQEKWGYGRSTSWSLGGAEEEGGSRGEDWVMNRESRARMARGHVEEANYGVGWLTGKRWERIGENGGCGQVDPLALCEFLLKTVKERGVKVLNPVTVRRSNLSKMGALESITISTASQEEVVLPATHILLSAGAWTPRVFKTLFPGSTLVLPITSLSGHSLTFQRKKHMHDQEEGECHAVFATHDAFSPEWFRRKNGDIYLGGLNTTSIPLPSTADQVVVDEEDIKILKQVAKESLTRPIEEYTIKESLCHRPITPGGTPVLDRISSTDSAKMENGGGVFVACGHGPWGINLSLGTGKVMAEMMLEKPMSADVSELGLKIYRKRKY